MSTRPPRPFPKLNQWLLETGLYDAYKVAHSRALAIAQLEYFDGRIDFFCPQCKRNSTFQAVVRKAIDPLKKNPNAPRLNAYADDDYNFFGLPDFVSGTGGYHTVPASSFGPEHQDLSEPAKTLILRDHLFAVHLHCARDSQHTACFIFKMQASSLSKVGQYPSRADIDNYIVDKYRTIIDPRHYRELTRAIGLNSHGIGIGSFIYLRRIIEFLIEHAHQAASLETGWQEAAYIACRISERISMLKRHLPEFIVNNHTIYSILSKAVHELEEEECLAMFPVMLNSIELILDDHLAMVERNRKLEETRIALQKIHMDLSNRQ